MGSVVYPGGQRISDENLEARIADFHSFPVISADLWMYFKS